MKWISSGSLFITLSDLLLLTLLCCGTTCSTCELYGTNYGVLCIHKLKTLEVKIAYCKALAKAKSVNASKE